VAVVGIRSTFAAACCGDGTLSNPVAASRTIIYNFLVKPLFDMGFGTNSSDCRYLPIIRWSPYRHIVSAKSYIEFS
jgi:hypothetical protein